MKKRILSIFLAAAMAAGVMPVCVSAAEPVRVLALGDSITAGYGLAEGECFTALLGDDYTVSNQAVSGSTAADVAEQLRKGVIAKEIAEADVIAITVGGNDMLALFYARVAELYHAKNDPDIQAADVAARLSELDRSNLMQNQSLLRAMDQLLRKGSANYLMDSQEFAKAEKALQQKLIGITATLKQINPDVKIVVADQYNPYVEFAGDPLLHSFYAGVEECVTRMNAAIRAGAVAGEYNVANVKAAFQQAHSGKNDLYNANPDRKNISLDFHPSAAGHIVLAEVFKEAIVDSAQDSAAFGDCYGGAVAWAVKKGVVPAASAETFRSEVPCTRGQAVTFLWRAAGSPAPKCAEMNFTDVSADSYCYDTVLWAVENGIVKGTSDTVFGSDSTCTRGQIMTFLWRSQKMPVVSGVNDFKDVAADAYYSNAVLWAAKNGITSGTSADMFSPDANCTCGQIIAFLWRLSGDK